MDHVNICFVCLDGRPLYILRLGQMDTKGLVRALGEESLLRHVRNTSCNTLRVCMFQYGFIGQGVGSWITHQGMTVPCYVLTGVLTTGCIQYRPCINSLLIYKAAHTVRCSGYKCESQTLDM